MQALKFVFGVVVLISPALAVDFFPLEPGNMWVYRASGSADRFTVSIGPPTMKSGREYYVLFGYVPQPELVRLNEDKDLVRLDQNTGNEQLLTSLRTLRGRWWEASARGCREEGTTLDRGTVHDGLAGPIRDVREISYRVIGCADFGVESEQYAGNIGMVRRVNNTISGPVTYDLVMARVGNIVINAMPHASFSVSLGDTSPTEVTMILRAQTNSPFTQTLGFPSAQEFDAVVRDEQGRVVWKWSEGRVFAAAEHEMILTSDWAVPITIPRDVLQGFARTATYTVQAWLTTASSSPYFAASAVITTADLK